MTPRAQYAVDEVPNSRAGDCDASERGEPALSKQSQENETCRILVETKAAMLLIPKSAGVLAKHRVQSLLICAGDVPYFITPVSTNSMSLLTRCPEKEDCRGIVSRSAQTVQVPRAISGLQDFWLIATAISNRMVEIPGKENFTRTRRASGVFLC